MGYKSTTGMLLLNGLAGSQNTQCCRSAVKGQKSVREARLAAPPSVPIIKKN